MKTTDALILFAAALSFAAAASAAEVPEEKKPVKENYAFGAGAPPNEAIDAPRRGAGDAQQTVYGMSDVVLPGEEAVDASDALAAEYRRVEEQALKAKDAYIGKNPDALSPDKDRVQLLSGEYVTGSVQKKEMSGLWIDSAGKRSYYLWGDLQRQDGKQKK